MHRCLLLIALVLAITAHAAPDRWYVLEMQGQRAGWLVERERADGDLLISESTTHLTLRRAETEVTLDAATAFAETADGRPVRMSATTNFGGSVTTDTYEWRPDGLVWSHSTGGTAKTEAITESGGVWLTPAAASRFVEARLAAGAGEVTVRTLDPLNGVEPVTTTRSAFEPVTIEVMGRSVEAIRCVTVSSLYPDVRSVEHIDDRGRLLRSEMNLGAMTITVVAADEHLARADLDPPELMRAVFVKPDRPINDPYRAARSSFIVSATSGTLPDLPTAGTQRAERLDERSVRVTRDLAAAPAPADGPGSTASSVMLNTDDPRVIELTREALTAAPDRPAERAERLRRFVHRHIRTKDLSVGFASAAETARAREGDCTEHAVLLAAMLRAEGIPSRVASGLIYADRFAGGEDIFGYHMWTQALLSIDGADRWVDLDATLPDEVRVTAVHIALSVDDLSGSSRVNALVELAPLMGRLAITVEQVE